MKMSSSDPQYLTETVFSLFRKVLRCLKKWFISAFPEIQKISQNLGPYAKNFYKIESLMKSVHRIRKTSQNRFFAFSKDTTILKKWFISAFPEIQKISQNLGPYAKQFEQNWIFNEKVHRIRKTPENRFFDFFEKTITMLKNWFISAFPEIEKISQNLCPKLGTKIVKNCIFNENVHRIPQNLTKNRLFAFSKDITDAKEVISSAHFLKSRKYLKIWATYAKNL